MSEYIYINGMTPAMVAEAVAQARSEIATMTGAEVMQWSKQWTDLAVQAPWNPMAHDLGMLYATEMHARMTKATVEVVAEAKMDDTYPVKIYTAAEVATIEAAAGVRK